MRRHVKKNNKKGDNMKLNLQKKNKGFTLIEILLVVGFIALASVGVYTIYSKVQVSNKANAESRSLDLVRAGIKSLYASKSTFLGLTNTVVNQARITPEAMKDPTAPNGASITNSFGGTVTIAPTNLNLGTNNGFRITYTKVPGDVCVKLAAAAGAQFDVVNVAGTDVKAFGVNDINVATLTAQCGSDTTGVGLTLYFDSL
jgi:prepilin-type N-terminal cleavage/methylation domain-containing protein